MLFEDVMAVEIGQLKKGKFTYACMLDLWLTVRTLVSKTVLSFWSPHLLPTNRMNAWAKSSPYPTSACEVDANI